MSELYRAIAGSPITYLSSDISAAQTTISIADDSALPDAPNICTIGYGENIETIRYGAKSNGVLQNVTRGLEGTPRAWKAGTEVARFYTAYEHNAIVETIKSHLAEDMQEKEVHGIKLADYVIEQGENYTKWASGKLEQWGTVSVTPETEYWVDFPIRFSEVPHIIGSVNRPGGYNNLSVQIKGTATNFAHFYVYAWATEGSTPSTIRVNWFAIGRWK